MRAPHAELWSSHQRRPVHEAYSNGDSEEEYYDYGPPLPVRRRVHELSRSPKAAEEEEECDCSELVFDSCAVLCCEPSASCRPKSCALAGVYLLVLALTAYSMVDNALNRRSRADMKHSNSNRPIGPPLRRFASTPDVVDVVYMWVNGSHPRVVGKLREAIRTHKLPYKPHASRYRDDSILQYGVPCDRYVAARRRHVAATCVAAVLAQRRSARRAHPVPGLISLLSAPALMGRVRHVYIVTGGEVPTTLLPRWHEEAWRRRLNATLSDGVVELEWGGPPGGAQGGRRGGHRGGHRGGPQAKDAKDAQRRAGRSGRRNSTGGVRYGRARGEGPRERGRRLSAEEAARTAQVAATREAVAQEAVAVLEGSRSVRPVGEGDRPSEIVSPYDLTTNEIISEPLRTLIERCAPPGAAGAAAAAASADNRKLFVVPHSVIFPDPGAELPAFNSNAILAVLHRIPGLSDWFIYSDDDMVISRKSTGLSAWWDEKAGAQLAYFDTFSTVNRNRAHVRNNWEQAMTYMAGLLDAVPQADEEARRAAEAQRSNTTALARWWGGVHSWWTKPWRSGRGPPARLYDKPQHMPILLSKQVVEEMERRWPADFARTRRSRLRQRREIEINFLYNHYLRVARYPVIMAPTGQTKFHYLQDCAGAKGLRACSESLTHPHHRFVCFNDGATSEREMLHGFANLRRLLSRHYPFCRAL